MLTIGIQLIANTEALYNDILETAGTLFLWMVQEPLMKLRVSEYHIGRQTDR
jgi:hypothetical protein